MGILSKLFGNKETSNEPKVEETVTYKGFTVEAAPIREDNYYRVAGYITGEIDGEPKRVRFIRADQLSDMGSAVSHAISKGQQIIDEQGESLLKKAQL
ncbi:MAG: HlyU family transcriptional regulator [Pseudomonadota bacterium]